MSDKTPMPKERPVMRVRPLTLTLMYDPERYCNGSMLMRMVDTERTIKRSEDEAVVGHVGAAMGGTVFVEIGDRLWKFDTLELFSAVCDAEEEQYLTPARSPRSKPKAAAKRAPRKVRKSSRETT